MDCCSWVGERQAEYCSIVISSLFPAMALLSLLEDCSSVRCGFERRVVGENATTMGIDDNIRIMDRNDFMISCGV